MTGTQKEDALDVDDCTRQAIPFWDDQDRPTECVWLILWMGIQRRAVVSSSGLGCSCWFMVMTKTNVHLLWFLFEHGHRRFRWEVRQRVGFLLMLTSLVNAHFLPFVGVFALASRDIDSKQDCASAKVEWELRYG